MQARVSRKGAVGLMQLVPVHGTTVRRKGHVQPEQNVDAGVRYLKTLLIRYNGNSNWLLRRTMLERVPWIVLAAFRRFGRHETMSNEFSIVQRWLGSL